MKKKILFGIIMALAVVCMLALSVSAADVVVDGVHYTTYTSSNYEGYDGRAAVSQGNRTSTTLIVEIPDFIETEDGKKYVVDEIKNDAFYDNQTMTELRILSKYITKIPASMIANSHSTGALKKIYIDFSNITSIGSAGFNPSNQTNGNNPVSNSFYYYDAKAYIENGEDKVITCPDFSNCTSIGTAAFQGANFEKLIIPAAIEIKNQVFRKTTITELIIEGENREKLDYYAFQSCTNLKKVVIKSRNLTTISNDVFSNSYNIEEIYIDLSKCTSISSSAFVFSTKYDGGGNKAQWYNLEGEKIVDLSSMKTLKEKAFASSNLGSAKIIWPKALDLIENQVFRYCHINQALYMNASEGKTITLEYWAFNGNSFPLVVLGPGVTKSGMRLEVQGTLVALGNSIELTDGEVFSKSGSQFYGKAYTGTDLSTKSKVTVNLTSSATATYYGACGIDCSVILSADNSNVVISAPVHTWGEGVINVEYCPIGSVYDFECVYCDAEKSEGEGTVHDHSLAIITYQDGFMKKGVKATKCSNVECTSMLEETEETAEIFIFRGYSYSLTGSGSFISSFAVNHKALNDYNNASSEKIESYGVFAVVEANIVDGDPFAEGSKCAKTEYFGKEHDIFEMKLGGLTNHGDVALYCTAYITVGGKNLFVDNGEIKDTLENAVTFNKIIETVG